MEFSLPVANATVALKEVSPEISSPLLEETVILDPPAAAAAITAVEVRSTADTV